jgi:hypothetical protein
MSELEVFNFEQALLALPRYISNTRRGYESLLKKMETIWVTETILEIKSFKDTLKRCAKKGLQERV